MEVKELDLSKIDWRKAAKWACAAAALALVIMLRLAALAINLVLRLPVLSGVNTLGGALLGLLEGMMVVWLLIWLAPRLGIALPAENTYLLHFFMTVGPMGLLSSLS